MVKVFKISPGSHCLILILLKTFASGLRSQVPLGSSRSSRKSPSRNWKCFVCRNPAAPLFPNPGYANELDACVARFRASGHDRKFNGHYALLLFTYADGLPLLNQLHKLCWIYICNHYEAVDFIVPVLLRNDNRWRALDSDTRLNVSHGKLMSSLYFGFPVDTFTYTVFGRR